MGETPGDVETDIACGVGSKTVIASQRVAMTVSVAFAPRNDVAPISKTRLRVLAARYARGLQEPSAQRKQRAQGMPGAQCTRSLACKIKTSIRVSHHGHTGTTRHSPRNGFTAYFALSSVTTLFDTVACASSRRLDANDWGVGTTRLGRTRQRHSSSAPTASTASGPTLMTCATPLLSRPDGANQ